MKFIIITGPMAVGKMTVGMALAQKTGLKLFHNHMTIEPVVRLFDYGTPQAQRLISTFREQIFDEMAGSDLPGMIFTYVCAFNYPEDPQYMWDVMAKFEAKGAKTYLVELESDLDIRLERNATPLRLEEKPTKRNVEWSSKNVIASMDKYRMNSHPGEITHANYLRINNNHLSPDQVAQQICYHFNW